MPERALIWNKVYLIWFWFVLSVVQYMSFLKYELTDATFILNCSTLTEEGGWLRGKNDEITRWPPTLWRRRLIFFFYRNAKSPIENTLGSQSQLPRHSTTPTKLGWFDAIFCPVAFTISISSLNEQLFASRPSTLNENIFIPLGKFENLPKILAENPHPILLHNFSKCVLSSHI